MCGKFTQMMSWSEYVTLAGLIGAPKTGIETVTPMRVASILRLNDKGEREMARMRWGFVPRWERDPTTGKKHIHARAETVDERPTFMDAFHRWRGLIIVQTFNEGEEIAPTKTRQYVVTPNDGRPIAIAAIWDEWGEKHAGSLLTFAMLTAPANRLIGTIADRMPAIVGPEDWGKWLGEAPASPAELKALLKPFEGDWTMAPAQKAPAKKRPTPGPELF